MILPSVTHLTISLGPEPYVMTGEAHLMWEALDDIVINSLPSLTHFHIAFGTIGIRVQQVHVAWPLLRAVEATLRPWLPKTLRQAHFRAINPEVTTLSESLGPWTGLS